MDLRLLALAAGTALLGMLVLKLRGHRGGPNLMAPPGRKTRRITSAEVRRLGGLVKRADESEALRLIGRAGYDEAEARKLLALVARLEAFTGAGGRPTEPGWTEAVREEKGLRYGRAFDYDPTLKDQAHRGEDGAARF